MPDDNDETIEALREHYAFLAGVNTMIERTDRLALFAGAMTILVAIVISMQGGAWSTVGPLLGALGGGFIGHVGMYRRLRRRSFAQLKDQYQEIELQHMAEGGEN